MKKLLFLLSLLLATNAWTAYVSVETGEEVKVNDWVLIDEIQLNDSEGKLYTSILKYCSISVIVNEAEKKQEIKEEKTTKKPIAAKEQSKDENSSSSESDTNKTESNKNTQNKSGEEK